MIHRRSRIARAMLVVVVVALDCALIRASHLVQGGRVEDFRFQTLVVFVLPMANVLGVALILATRRAGPSRRFWAGFAACSAVGSILVPAGCLLIDRDTLISWVSSLGQWTASTLFGRTNMLDTTRIVILLAFVAAAFALPQILAASLVGLLICLAPVGRRGPDSPG